MALALRLVYDGFFFFFCLGLISMSGYVQRAQLQLGFSRVLKSGQGHMAFDALELERAVS
jgi:hypothetical protein